MVRLGAALLAAAPVLLAGAQPVHSAPQSVCVLDDERLDEVSGLVAVDDGYLLLNDGRADTTTLRLYRLDGGCRVSEAITHRAYDPFDTEDMGRTPDGALWIADVGDNTRTRREPAVLRLAPGGRGVKYTLSYPDGAHDAEALLMQPDGVAVIVTKELSGLARVFATVRPLEGAAASVPLRDVGVVPFEVTDTVGGPTGGGVVSTLVTGGAVSPDGRRVALRTYTDAYEWDVSGGDIAAALVAGTPRRTPLPGEPQGEAISYTADGSAFVTVSEGLGQPLQRWEPVRPSPSPRDPSAEPGRAAPDRDVSWIAVLVGATGAVAVAGVLVLVVLLVVALRRRSRRS